MEQAPNEDVCLHTHVEAHCIVCIRLRLGSSIID